MNFIKALVKSVVEVPIATIKDAVTFGGSERPEGSYLKETYEEILDELE